MKHNDPVPYINPEGNTCSHHPDDPAHGPQCVYYPPPADDLELTDAEVDAKVTLAIMDVHTGPFQKLEDIPIKTLWTWYRAIYRAGRRSAMP